jgi:SAM-dependent methyltransferase
METRVSDLDPPLPYDAASFGLVYALSVFTHLPAPMQRTWIDELARILRPGGALLFTVSGEAYTDHLSAEEREAFRGGELITHFDEVAGTNMCAAYHPRRYVEERLLDGFEILEVVEPGREPGSSPASLAQDTYLCRKPA